MGGIDVEAIAAGWPRPVIATYWCETNCTLRDWLIDIDLRLHADSQFLRICRMNWIVSATEIARKQVCGRLWIALQYSVSCVSDLFCSGLQIWVRLTISLLKWHHRHMSTLPRIIRRFLMTEPCELCMRSELFIYLFCECLCRQVF